MQNIMDNSKVFSKCTATDLKTENKQCHTAFKKKKKTPVVLMAPGRFLKAAVPKLNHQMAGLAS